MSDVALEPGWIQRGAADARIRLMASHGRSHPALAFMRDDRLTDVERHRLFMRLEAQFKAWTGESFVAFMVRTQSEETSHD